MDPLLHSCDRGLPASGQEVEEFYSAFSDSELVALQGLVKLGQWSRERDAQWTLTSWSRKRKRSGVAYSDREQNEHVTVPNVVKLAPPAAAEMAAVAAAAVPVAPVAVAVVEAEAGGVKLQGSVAASPTTPLLWSGSERASLSSHGDGSDSTHSRAVTRPPTLSCDRPRLGPKLKFKIERKAGAYSLSNRRGPKRKTPAEWMEEVNLLSSENEEMKKALEDYYNKIETLRNQNKHLKEKVVLWPGKKKEDQLHGQNHTISPYTAKSKLSIGNDEPKSSENLVEKSPLITVRDWNSSAERISPPHQMSSLNTTRENSLRSTDFSSSGFILPDLNIPVEDLANNVSIGFDNQLLKEKKAVDLPDNFSSGFDNQVHEANNRAVFAAARKHRMECCRVKHSQSVKKARSR